MPARRTPSPEPRAPLSRERVLRAAIALADEAGIEALTMRELGLRLGVEAMSLYNHVANKDDVLDGMVDLVVGEIDLPSDTVDWREAMRRRAISAQAVFSRHPWASALIDSRESACREAALLRVGDRDAAARRILRRAGGARVLGPRQLHLRLRTAAVPTSGSGAEPEEMAEAFLAAIPADEYPYLRELVVEHAMDSGYDDSADLEFGLDLILDGLQRLLVTPP